MYEYEWSYDPVTKRDMILLDKGDEVVYLTSEEFEEFLELIKESSDD